MPYLLDSDWAIHALNGVPPYPERLRDLAGTRVSISAISVAEIYEGVLGDPERAHAMEGFNDLVASSNILPVDFETGLIAGRERQRLRSIGQMIGPMDILIAATALRHDLTLLTNNVRDFGRFAGLRIESL